ncbi:MAG: hypothetical protein A2340_16340 [Lentisphaerae bacterium RIFOXYB12_FULL_60_10]|nr:MAG: hypothetical protein A2269_08015 [Lentisphaerae bacterium RIFOXYA12_FULL_60_10]OGV85980.1 MAG: hypothetical protein A2340_16340 [Lentisphaerae bacterium RIFOXYB12_FULL_60_10]
MSERNQLFKVPKTRRFVSAWTVLHDEKRLLAQVGKYADLFDQLVLMCGAPTAAGKMPTSWPVKARRRLAAELGQMNVSILNDYGGGWQGCGEGFSRSPAKVAALARRMADECEATGADGVDIDFEKWPAESRFAYTDFLACLSEHLHARGKLLSICAYPYNAASRRETGIGFIDPSLVAPLVDQYRAMVYDLFCPPSQYVGPTSTAPWGRECMNYLVAMIPRHKLIMGLPTYSVDWNINDPTQSRQVNDAAFIAAREKESPIGRGWCYFADVNLIRYNDAAGHAHLVWVSDAMSTRSHLETVEALDLTGISFWVLDGAEDVRIWQAVLEKFRRT